MLKKILSLIGKKVVKKVLPLVAVIIVEEVVNYLINPDNKKNK